MKLLLLSKKFPYPLRDGESQAIHGLSKSLSELGVEVSLLAMNTSKHFFEGTELPKETSHFKEVRTVNVCTKLKAKDAAHNLLLWKSYHISRFDQTAYHLELQRWLNEENFDVIQLETLYLAPYVETIRRVAPDALISMRAHNVEFEIWQRVCENINFLPKRWYMRMLTSQLCQYEKDHLNTYDLLLPITSRDDDHFRSMGFNGISHVLPIGLDTADVAPNYDTYRAAPSLAFIGSLDWTPNLEGLEWFVEKVWPQIHAAYPEVIFHIAGRNMPDSMRKLERTNIIVHGEVPDSNAFLNAHSISIVPLLSGSGMRAKILQSMALGRTVVTTSVGLEGIDARDNKEVLIADPPEAFAKVVINCLANARQLESIGRAAVQLFEDRYDRHNMAERLIETYHRQLAQRNQQRLKSINKTSGVA
ncbi:glycosyl transferase family 1 [Lewinellaceae bacterium SD302]|nr:glycosyl transferase family 1 [Lewinellaceae bacterium SD302]